MIYIYCWSMVGVVRMRAIQADRFGGPEVLRLVEKERPRPRDGEVVIRLDYAGVNFADAHFREGGRGGVAPFVPGVEGAGTVAYCASDVIDFEPGERVAYWTTNPGSYAEYAAVPAWRLVRIPDGISADVACALTVQGLTAHYLTHSTFPLGPSRTCLILAAASGVGLLMIQMAKLLGARVIAAVGTQEKALFARACGADEVIPYRVANFDDETRRLTGGEGVDVVYDSIGAETFLKSINSVRIRGLCVVYGMASGPLPPFDTSILNQVGSIFFTRPNIVHYLRSAEEIQLRAAKIFSLYLSGQLDVTIAQTYDLGSAVEAHETLHDRRTAGKILLRL
jgi:NADPH2:quinone reductase